MLASVSDGSLAPAAAKIAIAASFPTFSFDDVSRMVDAQAAGSAPSAAPSAAPAPGATASIGASATTTVSPGSRWIDTADGHHLQVTSVADGNVYFVDLDDANPARQWAWKLATFLERAQVDPDFAEAAMDAAPAGGADAALPLAKPSPMRSRSLAHPFASTLSRR